MVYCIVFWYSKALACYYNIHFLDDFINHKFDLTKQYYLQ